MNIVPLPMQKKVLESSKQITLLTVGNGSGSTYALYLSALNYKGSIVKFISNTSRNSNILMEGFVEFLDRSGIEYTTSCRDRIVYLKNYDKSVTFYKEVNYKGLWSGLYLIDNAHNLSYSYLGGLLDNLGKEESIVLTSPPKECGWVSKDDKAWDHVLFNAEVRGVEVSPDLKFKVSKSSYKPNVNLLKGYEMYDNLHLMESCPMYRETIESLLEGDSILKIDKDSVQPSSLVHANISDMKEMYTRLLEGEVFIYEGEEVKYDKDTGDFLCGKAMLKFFKTQFKDFLVKKSWTDFVSDENPILCQVWDGYYDPEEMQPVYTRVVGYWKENEHPYITHLSTYENAEPVKPSECFQGE